MTAGSSVNAGEFTFGTGTVTACTVTFATGFPNAGFWTVTPEVSLGTVTYYISARSKTSFTVTLSASTPSAKFTYAGFGN